MIISHEFPLQYYLNGIAEKYTDYDYCLVHRYIECKEYRDYFLQAKEKGRMIILDNGLYEMGSSFSGEEYAKVIKELKPDYYLLPDVLDNYEENIKKQKAFYAKYHKLESVPMATIQGSSISEMIDSFRVFDEYFPSEVVISFPNKSNGWANEVFPDSRYITKDIISYRPLREIMNRKKFIKDNYDELSFRSIHLLGCMSIAAYDDWGEDFNKDFIISNDTSLPVALGLEENMFENGFENPIENGSLDSHLYKPKYLIDKHFYDKTEGFENYIINNIKFYRKRAEEWINGRNKD